MMITKIMTVRIIKDRLEEDQVAKLVFQGWAWKGRRGSLGWHECNGLRITGGRQGSSR